MFLVAPKFVVKPKDPTEAVEGSSVMIDCVVEGNPKPTIQWDKDSRMNDFDHSRYAILTYFLNKNKKIVNGYL